LLINDGWQDILLVAAPFPRLYHNQKKTKNHYLSLDLRRPEGQRNRAANQILSGF
jgi:hypothetical protein